MSDRFSRAEIAAVLRKAAEYVERGWTQEVMARDSTGLMVDALSRRATCWCGIGAICAALGENATFAFQRGATFALEDFLGCDDAAVWNDDPARTQAEVAAALKGAADHVDGVSAAAVSAECKAFIAAEAEKERIEAEARIQWQRCRQKSTDGKKIQ